MTFSIGTVFSRAFSIIGQNAALILGVGLMTYALPCAIIAAILLNMYGLDIADPLTWGREQLIGIGAFGFTSLIMYFINLSVVTELAIVRSVNRRFDLGVALRRSLVNFFPLLIIIILTSLAMMLGLILLIVPGIIAALAFSVATPAYVAEGKVGIFGAFTRSRELTKTHRWAILFIYILLGIASGTISSVLDTLLLGLIEINPVVMVGLGAFKDVLLNIIGIVFTVALYVTLREANEGLNVDSAASVFE